MKWLIASLVILATWAPTNPPRTEEPKGECSLAVGLGGAGAGCIKDAAALQGIISGSPTGVWYSILPVCRENPQPVQQACAVDMRCDQVDGGFLFWIIRHDLALPGGRATGKACLTRGQAARLNLISPAMVQREFERLEWAASVFEMDPNLPRTLVNLETWFMTDNSEPLVQTVTLLGHRIDIEGTPSEYEWDFGDGSATLVTQSPGGHYPEGEVTHTYREAGEFDAVVDTTYSGRYRIDGGAWQTLPDTLTVDGDPLAVEPVEAKPKLT